MTSHLILVNFVVGVWSVINHMIIVDSKSCSHTVSGYSIDLSDLDGTTISYTTSDSWQYSYTPCQDGLTCTDSDKNTDKAMATQKKTTNDFCTAYLALWTDVEPSYSDGTFTFTWSNGEGSNDCPARTFIAKWSCGTSAYSVSGVSQSGCEYTMTLSSKYACGSSSGSSSSDDVLSFGSVLLIIASCCIFLYCAIGYVICAKKNPENGWTNVKANTPHLSFWCAIPKYAWAGCCVTKEFTMNKVNEFRGQAGGESGYDTVGDTEA